MSDSTKPVAQVPCPVRPTRVHDDESVVCERCNGANVYRMHAVWRCADCGYKTDCCGW